MGTHTRDHVLTGFGYKSADDPEIWTPRAEGESSGRSFQVGRRALAKRWHNTPTPHPLLPACARTCATTHVRACATRLHAPPTYPHLPHLTVGTPPLNPITCPFRPPAQMQVKPLLTVCPLPCCLFRATRR